MLKLITLKQRGQEFEEFIREVPVYRGTLKALNRYVKRIRSRLIKKINKRRKGKNLNPFVDHGFVFISETTGQPLKPDSITTMFNEWASAINAKGNLIAHAFRHAYITEKIEMLIKLFELESESDLKAKFATEQSLKIKLLSWTGHKSIKSLENYIHLAFEDISGINATMDKTLILSGINSAKDEINELKNKITFGQLTPTDLIDEFENMLDDLVELLQTK